MPLKPTTCELREFIRASSFASGLTEQQLARVECDVSLRHASAGEYVWVDGSAAEHWIGVVKGVLKVETSSPDGHTMTLLMATPGCWFGEALMLHDCGWAANVLAISNSELALLPRRTFKWLLDSSLSFNRFILHQLDARLTQFAIRWASVSSMDANRKVALSLLHLFHPRLYPSACTRLSLSQEEIGHLAGVSRAAANRALNQLQLQGFLTHSYGTITILDIAALRRYCMPRAQGSSGRSIRQNQGFMAPRMRSSTLR